MAPPVMDRPRTGPQDSWASAPVAVGRHRRRLGRAAVLCCVGVVLLGMALVWHGRAVPAAGPHATGPVARPETGPVTRPDMTSGQFDVTVEVTDVVSIDNDGMFGRRPSNPDGAVEQATRDVAQVLDRYLDAQFVAADSRFSDRPVQVLLGQDLAARLSNADLSGLGVLDVAVAGADAEPVGATARVLTRGSDAVVVAVRYDARARVLTSAGDTVPLRQRATIVFTSEHGTWRAAAVDATLDLPLETGEVAR